MRVDHVIRLRTVWLVFLVVMPSASVSGQTTPDGARTPDDVARVIVQQLREQCATSSSLKGIRVAGAELSNGQLQLSGTLDSEQQRQTLEAVARQLIDNMPGGHARLPNGVQTNGLELFPIRSRYLKELQNACVESTRSDDLRSRKVLPRTRLDDAYFAADGSLAFVGICLADEWFKREAEDGNPANDPAVFFSAVLHAFLTQRTEGDLVVNARGIQVLASPIWELQQLALGDPELDGILFDDGVFDEAGVLQLSGRVVSAQQVARLERLLEREFPNREEILGPAEQAPQAWSLARIRTPNEGVVLVRAVQAALADSQDPLSRQTRIDRIYFRYADTRELRFHVAGVCTHANFTDSDQVDRFAASLREVAKGIVRDPASDRYAVDVASGVKAISSPVSQLQQRVSQDPRMDGLLIASTEYDALGNLVLHGLASDTDQIKRLRPYLDELSGSDVLRASSGRDDIPWTSKGLRLFDLRNDVMKRIQAVMANSGVAIYQAIRLDRVFFRYDKDARRRLEFQGVCLDRALDGASKRGVFADQLHIACSRLLRHIPSTDYSVGASAIETIADPVPDLQNLTNGDRRLDGALIQRASFDADGLLRLHGFLDHAAQRSWIGELVDRYLEDPRILRQPDVRPSLKSTLDTMEVTPIRGKLFGKIQAAFASSDDAMLRKTRVDRMQFHYSENQQLTLKFRGTSIDPAFQSTELAAHLRNLCSDTVTHLPPEQYVVNEEFTRSESYPPRTVQVLANQEDVQGVWILDAWYDSNGILQLAGICSEEEAKRRIDGLMEKTYSGSPVLRPDVDPDEGRAWSLANVEIYPLRDDFARLLGEMQGGLADSPDLVFHRTRIDTIVPLHSEGGYPRLGISGLRIRSRQERDDAFDELQKRLMIQIQSSLKRPPAGSYGIQLQISDSDDPRHGLHEHFARNPAFDGVYLASLAFGADGRLKFQGLIDGEQQRDMVVEVLRSKFSDNAIWRAQSEFQEAVSELRDYSLSGHRQQIQETFSTSDTALLRRTLLARTYFDVAGQLHLTGVSMRTRVSDRDQVDDNVLRQNIAAEVQRALEQTPARATAVQSQGVVVIQDPATAIQAAVADTEALDGVRIEDATIDAEGSLALEGLWTGDSQSEPLQRLVSGLYANGPALPLVRHDLALGGLSRSGCEQLLGQLRLWCADNLDEARIERVYFDPNGNLVVKGFCTHQVSKTRLQDRIQQVIGQPPWNTRFVHLQENIPVSELPPVRQVNRTERRPYHLVSYQRVDPRIPVNVQIEILRKSFTQYFREQIPSFPEFDGIMVQRGYFDRDGRFVLSGLEDSPGQARRLEALLSREELTSQWRRHLRDGWQIGRFDSVPVTPIIRCVRRLMPVYRELDGVEIKRIYHDGENRLVLGGFVYGRYLEANAGDPLVRLLKTHDSLRMRTQAGVSIDGITFRPRLDDTSDKFSEAMGFVRQNNPWSATKALDEVILHDSLYQDAWDLRAFCYLLQGDDWAARRDLRRAVMIDMGARQRYRLLERFQGADRLRLESMRTSVALESSRRVPFSVDLRDVCENH